MSSSNLVSVTMLKEVTAGTTPPAPAPFETMRFTSESLNGAAETIASEELNPSRASAGVINVGLTVNGDINAEFSPSPIYKELILSAMMSPSWTAAVSSTAASYVVDNVAKTITGAGYDLTTIFTVGSTVKLDTGFVANQGKAVYISAVTPTVVTYVGELVDETAATGVLKSPESVGIGGGANTTVHSYTLSKQFLDLVNKSLTYRGSTVNTWSMAYEWGQIIQTVFGFVGLGWEVPALPVTDGRTINPATTQAPLNGSSQVGTILINNQDLNLCFSSLNIALNNNDRSNQCIGRLSSTSVTPGQAQIDVTASLYLGDNSWEFIQKKITNESVSLYVVASSAEGGIAILIPALTVPGTNDPLASGPNTDVMLELVASARQPATGNLMTVYWL